VESGGKKGRRRRVIDERRWPLSPRCPPTRPDRIKLLEDGRKYRGSTRSCRLEKKRRGTRGEDESARASESRTRKKAVTIEPSSGRGRREREDEEEGLGCTPRNAVLQLLRSSCCVNVLIRSAWARPIRDTAGHYFACHAIACAEGLSCNL